MSKGAWSVLVYPESADIRACVDLFVGTGAEYSYILHDKDRGKDGNPKKPHYHLTLGWVTGCPGFGKLRQMCKACGAVALSEQACTVHDGEACEEYELHKNAPDKYQYSEDERVRSDAFYMGDYVTADEKRTRRRAEKKKAAQSDLAAFMGQIMDIVREHELLDLAAVAQYCAAVEGFDMGMFWENSARIKAYCDSVRGMYYADYKQRYEDKCAENSRLVREKVDSVKAFNEVHRQCMELAGELYECKRLLHSLAAAGYDISPAWWEIDLTAAEWERYFTNDGNERKAKEYKEGWKDE